MNSPLVDMPKIKLEPTAALMMHFGKKAFNNDVIQSFIDHLDLSPGEDLYEKCKSICEWYDEVVINRKYFISNFIRRKLAGSSEEYLVISLAAGNFPLSLEILLNNPDRVNKILEIDITGMDEKKEIYDRFYPEFTEKIKCITADITLTSILSLLNNLLHEYYNEIPCIIIMEGVIYYLKPEELENIVYSFRSETKNNTFIVEYLLPIEAICTERKQIPERVFELIKNSSGLKEISSYTKGELASIFEKYDGELIELESMAGMEKKRLGQNKYFNKIDDGWIECSVWQI